MPKNNKEDIFKGIAENYTSISLLSQKLRILIIGSGKGGLIKAKHFLENKCNVWIMTKEPFDIKGYEKAVIINKEYEKKFILDKHIIVIAVNDKKVRDEIKNHCKDLYKIYIDASNFKEGLAVLPVQKNTKSSVFAVNTKGGNPKASIFLSRKIEEEIKKYDDYIEFTTGVREVVKKVPKIKDEVLSFLFCEDFFYFFSKDKAIEVLKMFYCEV